MLCRKCGKEIEAGWVACPFCGTKVAPTKKAPRRRANGSGTAFKRGSTWTAQVTVGMESDGKGGLIRHYRTKGGFPTKKEALAYAESLLQGTQPIQEAKLSEVYERWAKQHAARITERAMANYRCSYKHLAPLHARIFRSIRAEDWQACLDNAQVGKGAKELIKTLCGLLSKFALDHDWADKNYAANIYTGSDKKGTRPSFTKEELETIRAAVGKVPYADYVYFLCLTGFRPGEFFKLTRESYNADLNVLVGGGKTIAGMNRTVPVHPELMPILRKQLLQAHPYLFSNASGDKLCESTFRLYFDQCMATLGITGRVPYSCRHTFANLLKGVQGSDTDKAALIGHSDASMTKYYQSTDVDTLRRITDAFSL